METPDKAKSIRALLEMLQNAHKHSTSKSRFHITIEGEERVFEELIEAVERDMRMIETVNSKRHLG